MKQLHMSSKMVEVEQVVLEGADSSKYRDLLSVEDEAKKSSTFFKSEWERYVRSSPGVATTELRDQLFSCPDENLRTALHRSH